MCKASDETTVFVSNHEMVVQISKLTPLEYQQEHLFDLCKNKKLKDMRIKLSEYLKGDTKLWKPWLKNVIDVMQKSYPEYLQQSEVVGVIFDLFRFDD